MTRLAATSRLALLFAPASLLMAQDDNPAAGCAGCLACGVFPVIVFVAIVALHIAILVWVARDAKSRGMDSAVLWMILVMLTGLIGLIIYLLARPQGNLIPCPNCHNNRLQASLRCPHCGA
jgi:ABC-type tungstate transport system substrate-binding protein